jgi:hypothetical protein
MMREVTYRSDDNDDGDYYAGTYEDARGRTRRLSIRRAPLRIWNGNALTRAGQPQGHYFEIIAEETFCAALRKSEGD